MRFKQPDLYLQLVQSVENLPNFENIANMLSSVFEDKIYFN